jgi:hypothetical protein
MPSHNDKDSDQFLSSHGPNEVDASKGFEQTDAHVTGIVVFLASLAILVVVVAVLCYGIGKVFNAELNREDGPDTKWTKTVDIRQLGNLPNSPELQNKVAELTRSFPTPRLQTDDGNEDLAELHAREDLLLENYSWVDRSKGTVRIPIERAMELIAEHGLPVMPAQQLPPPMTGDVRPQVTAPLTDGFARTAYEQQQEKDREEAEKIAEMQQQ